MHESPNVSDNKNRAALLKNIQMNQISLNDWQTEKLNFVPLRGSWFANSDADFELEVEIDKFLSPQNAKKIMLLMGDSGSGKSLYTQGLVVKLWQNFSAQSPIPIWISLPSLKDPVNRAIEETLIKYGFNKDQIEELRKTSSFIFILDAYDEIRCTQNLYQINNLDKWNAKIIFTCRREYLYDKDNYKLFFAPFLGDKIQYLQYEEIYVRPFNANQIQSYVQQYINTKKPNWDNPEKYQKAMEEITGLKELIKTPFMLKLTMEVLPQIVERYATQNIQNRKKVTQAALYDVFIEQWFIRQEQKLKQAKQIKEEENIKPEFWSYAKELATQMHKANLTQINYNPSDDSDLFNIEEKENQWGIFFTPKNPRIEILRTACLVREISLHHYAFIHSSLLEYFLTRNLYENILERETQLINAIPIPQIASHLQNKEIMSATPVTALSSSSQYKLGNNNKEDYFNQRLLVQEENTLQFLADRVSEQDSFKKLLFDRVYSSRNKPENKIVAANAITILNYARVPFFGRDLSNIHIPDADLIKANFHFSNLSNSDLSRVNLQDAYLCNANLSGCLMDGVNFGQLPFFNHQSQVHVVCYSKDGQFLAVAEKNNIIIWNLGNRQHYRFLQGHTNDITSIILNSNNSLLISSSNDRSVRVWHLFNQQVIGKPFAEQINKNSKISLHSDGKTLAGCSNEEGTILLWDIATHCLIRKLHTDERSCVEAVEYSPNGNLLAASSYNQIWLWDTNNLQMINKFGIGTFNLAFSLDSKLLAGTTDNSINKGRNGVVIFFIDLVSQEIITRSLLGHTADIATIALSHDGKILASGSFDRSIRLWDIVTFQQIGMPMLGHSGDIMSIAFNNDDTLLASGSSDQTVRIWNIKINGMERIFSDKNNAVTNLALSSNGDLLVSAHRQFYFMQNVSTSFTKTLIPLDNDTESIKTVVFNKSGSTVAAVDKYGYIKLWEVSTYGPFTVLGKHENDTGVVSILFSKDGKTLSSWDQGRVQLWDVSSRKLINKINLSQSSIKALTFSYDSKLVIFIAQDTDPVEQFNLWIDKTGSEEQKRVRSILRVHNIIDEHEIMRLEQNLSKINCISINQTKQMVAIGSKDGLLHLWDFFNTQKHVEPLTGHVNEITAVEFIDSENKLLLSASLDTTVRVWYVDSRQCNQIINVLSGVIALSINYDTRHFGVLSDISNGVLEYNIMPGAKTNYRYFWYSTNYNLAVNNLCLAGVKGLSANNSQLLNELGAIAKLPESTTDADKQDLHVKPSLATSHTENSPNSSLPLVYAAQNPHTIYQPDRHVPQAGRVSANKANEEKSSRLSDDEHKKEKCLVM